MNEYGEVVEWCWQEYRSTHR